MSARLKKRFGVLLAQTCIDCLPVLSANEMSGMKQPAPDTIDPASFPQHSDPTSEVASLRMHWNIKALDASIPTSIPSETYLASRPCAPVPAHSSPASR